MNAKWAKPHKKDIRCRSFKYSHSIPTDAAHAFGMLFIVCGIAAFAFNAAILFVLFYRRRSIFSHVFYIMIFNFALIDLLKSISLFVYFTTMNSSSLFSIDMKFAWKQILMRIYCFLKIGTFYQSIMVLTLLLKAVPCNRSISVANTFVSSKTKREKCHLQVYAQLYGHWSYYLWELVRRYYLWKSTNLSLWYFVFQIWPLSLIFLWSPLMNIYLSSILCIIVRSLQG